LIGETAREMASPILDVNCFHGYWPFRRMAYRTTHDLRRLMTRTGTHNVLVTPLAGIFYKDCLSAVREMLDELQGAAYRNMWPVAVINPVFPGWREDLETMVDEWGCVALRLFPNYHGYRLSDSLAAEMLEAAQERRLPLIISVRVEDERLQHRLARVRPVAPGDIMWVLRSFPNIRLILCEPKPAEVDELRRSILTHLHASVVTPSRVPQFYLEELVRQLGSQRIMYGTGMPLACPEGVLRLVQDAHLDEAARDAILCGNAVRVFGVECEE
jgi:predicted TIM-barrel fold metal-dependent hydrolase